MSSGDTKINSKLSSALNLLKCRRQDRPEIVGVSVFGRSEFFDKFLRFKRRLRGMANDKYFCVKLDVNDCYQTIDQSRLSHILNRIARLGFDRFHFRLNNPHKDLIIPLNSPNVLLCIHQRWRPLGAATFQKSFLGRHIPATTQVSCLDVLEKQADRSIKNASCRNSSAKWGVSELVLKLCRPTYCFMRLSWRLFDYSTFSLSSINKVEKWQNRHSHSTI